VGLFVAFAFAFVPAAGVDATLDFVGLDGVQVGLLPDLFDGFPGVPGVALAEAPLAGDFLGLTLFGREILEVAFARAGGFGAHHADFALAPFVAQEIAVGLAHELAVGVAGRSAPGTLGGFAFGDDVELAVELAVIDALPLLALGHGARGHLNVF